MGFQIHSPTADLCFHLTASALTLGWDVLPKSAELVSCMRPSKGPVWEASLLAAGLEADILQEPLAAVITANGVIEHGLEML